MINKLIRLIKALWQETLKRVPYIIALLIIIGMAAGIQSYRKTAEGVKIAKDNSVTIKNQGKDLKQQADDIKTLTQQNKNLSAQNNRLARANAAHIDCIARYFSMFATARLEDLDKCIITSTGTQISPSIIDRSEASDDNKSSQNQTSSQQTSQPGQNTGQNNSSTKPQEKQHEPTRVFGVPVCIPDPLSFVSNGLCVTN
jgi:cell division protein FtsB